MWLTTARSAPTPQLRNGQLASGRHERNRPKDDYGVGSAATVVAVSPFGLFSRVPLGTCVQISTPRKDVHNYLINVDIF